ncbi:MAG TPA: hypothetical protein VGF24_04065 [Vicinamibacterales bacterium]
MRTSSPLLSWLESFVTHPIAIFVAAVAVRAAIVLAFQLHHELFRAEVQRTAESLATTGVYGNPYLIPTGPTAHVSPLHTLMVAAMFYLFGTGVQGEAAVYALNIVLVAMVWSAIPWVATRLCLPRRPALIVAWFGAVVPFHFLNDVRAADSAVSALALVGILLTAQPVVRGESLTPGQSVRMGVVWGLSLLVLPTLVCVVAAIAVVGFWIQRAWSYVGQIAIAAAVAVLVLAPWAVRNGAALGEAVWFRSTLGMMLCLSYNDDAWPDAQRNNFGGSYDRCHPLTSVAAAQRLRDEGEVAYNKRIGRESLNWIQRHPGRSASLLLQRTAYFWFPRTPRWYQSLLLSLVSLLALAAIPKLLREHRSAAILFLVTWSSFPLVYYVMESAIRYRYPMIWTLLLAGSVLVAGKPGPHRQDIDSAVSKQK